MTPMWVLVAVLVPFAHGWQNHPPILNTHETKRSVGDGVPCASDGNGDQQRQELLVSILEESMLREYQQVELSRIWTPSSSKSAWLKPLPDDLNFDWDEEDGSYWDLVWNRCGTDCDSSVHVSSSASSPSLSSEIADGRSSKGHALLLSKTAQGETDEGWSLEDEEASMEAAASFSLRSSQQALIVSIGQEQEISDESILQRESISSVDAAAEFSLRLSQQTIFENAHRHDSTDLPAQAELQRRMNVKADKLSASERNVIATIIRGSEASLGSLKEDEEDAYLDELFDQIFGPRKSKTEHRTGRPSSEDSGDDDRVLVLNKKAEKRSCIKEKKSQAGSQSNLRQKSKAERAHSERHSKADFFINEKPAPESKLHISYQSKDKGETSKTRVVKLDEPTATSEYQKSRKVQYDRAELNPSGGKAGESDGLCLSDLSKERIGLDEKLCQGLFASLKRATGNDNSISTSDFNSQSSEYKGTHILEKDNAPALVSWLDRIKTLIGLDTAMKHADSVSKTSRKQPPTPKSDAKVSVVEVCEERFFPGTTVEKVKRAWVSEFWEKGGGIPATSVASLKPTRDPRYQSKRTMSPWRTEEALLVDQNSNLSTFKSTMRYTMTKSALLMGHDVVAGSHEGVVKFRAEDGGTKLSWVVSYNVTNRSSAWQRASDTSLSSACNHLRSFLASPVSVSRKTILSSPGHGPEPVPLTVREAMGAWLACVWRRGGNLPWSIAPPFELGDGVHVSTPSKVTEKLDLVDYETGEIQYSIPNPSAWNGHPMHTHKGSVRFDVRGECIQMTWDVQMRPYHNFDFIVRALTSSLVTKQSRKLQRYIIDSSHDRVQKSDLSFDNIRRNMWSVIPRIMDDVFSGVALASSAAVNTAGALSSSLSIAIGGTLDREPRLQSSRILGKNGKALWATGNRLSKKQPLAVSPNELVENNTSKPLPTFRTLVPEIASAIWSPYIKISIDDEGVADSATVSETDANPSNIPRDSTITGENSLWNKRAAKLPAEDSKQVFEKDRLPFFAMINKCHKALPPVQANAAKPFQGRILKEDRDIHEYAKMDVLYQNNADGAMLGPQKVDVKNSSEKNRGDDRVLVEMQGGGTSDAKSEDTISITEARAERITEKIELSALFAAERVIAGVEAEKTASKVAQISSKNIQAKQIALVNVEAEHTSEDNESSGLVDLGQVKVRLNKLDKGDVEFIAAAKADFESIVAQIAEAERIAIKRGQADGVWALGDGFIAVAKAEAKRMASEISVAEGIVAEKLLVKSAAQEEDGTNLTVEKEAEAMLVASQPANNECTCTKKIEHIATEKAEAGRVVAKNSKAGRIAAKREDDVRIADKKAEANRVAAEKVATERVATEKVKIGQIREGKEAEQKSVEIVESEQVAAGKIEAEPIAAERVKIGHIAKEK